MTSKHIYCHFVRLSLSYIFGERRWVEPRVFTAVLFATISIPAIFLAATTRRTRIQNAKKPYFCSWNNVKLSRTFLSVSSSSCQGQVTEYQRLPNGIYMLLFSPRPSTSCQCHAHVRDQCGGWRAGRAGRERESSWCRGRGRVERRTRHFGGMQIPVSGGTASENVSGRGPGVECQHNVPQWGAGRVLRPVSCISSP